MRIGSLPRWLFWAGSSVALVLLATAVAIQLITAAPVSSATVALERSSLALESAQSRASNATDALGEALAEYSAPELELRASLAKGSCSFFIGLTETAASCQQAYDKIIEDAENVVIKAAAESAAADTAVLDAELDYFLAKFDVDRAVEGHGVASSVALGCAIVGVLLCGTLLALALLSRAAKRRSLLE